MSVRIVGLNIRLLFCGTFFALGCSNGKECNVTHQKEVILSANKHLIRIYNDCSESPEIEYEAVKMPDSSNVYNGYYKEFYSDGKLSKIGFFKNNIQDSIAIKYRKDGTTDYDNYYFNGQQKGFQNSYHNNGQYLERTYCLNDSTITFKIFYSSLGKIEKMEGRSFNVFWDKEPSKVRLGESIFIGNEVVVLDSVNSDCRIFITQLSKNDTIFPNLISQTMNNAHYRFILFTPTQKGEFQYHSIVSLLSKNVVLKKDTMSFPLTVR